MEEETEFEAGGGGIDQQSGAGVKTVGSSPVFTVCLFDSNQNNINTVIYGGGAALLGGSPKFIDCIFQSNRSSHGGGIAIKNGATAVVLNCLIKGNTIYSGGTPIEPMELAFPSIDQRLEQLLIALS